MAAIQQDIDIYINKAQTKISLLGDAMLVRDIDGLSIDDSVKLIQELYATTYLLQNRPDDFTDTEVYELISTYNYKAKLTTLPISLFNSTLIASNILLNTGGYLIGPQGTQGDKGVQGDQGDPGADGGDGADGTNGWTAIPALVVDGARLVIQVTGWTGGTGSPPASGVYVGPSGFVSLIADAVNIRGTQGIQGIQGDTGDTGADGTSFYTYIAYASDASGTGFTTTFNANLDYIGIITSSSVIPTPSPSNFTGLWKNYKGAKGDPFIIDARGTLSGRNTYDTQTIGFTYLAEDTGNIYIKNSGVSGDWSPPISFVGDKGWSPVLSVITDGERRVFQITNWTGGDGTMPSTTNQFIGNGVIVATAADAVDIRGGTGNFIINAQDTLANRTTYDGELVPFIFLATDNGKIYFKATDASADWTAGFQWTGEQGIQGDPGDAGTNAFTTTNGTFTQPAVSSTVNVTMLNTDWIAVGQVIFIETAGYYQVSSIGSSTVATLTNLGYPGAAVPTTLIADASKVAASGIGNAGSGTWGAITGILADQTDLQTALDAKISTTLTSAHLLVGNGSNIATDVALSGDATISNAGVITLGNSGTIRGHLGLAIGTNVQAYSANLDSWSAITTASKLSADGSVAMTGNLDLGGNNAINANLVKVNDGGGIYNTSNNAHVNLEADGHIDFTGTGINATTVPYLDASKNLVSSAVTPTELGYVSGVTSSIQNQINNINAGLSWKNAARVATTANITLSAAQTIDGVSVIVGDRVLVKNQSTDSQNGIYVCASGAWTRATDANTGAGMLQATISIEEGTASADTIYTCTTDAPITIGVTSIAFVKTSATTYTGSTGVTLTGNNFTLDNSYFTGDITVSGGVTTIGASKVTNSMMAGSIAYSKLSLTGAILNADLAGSIAASKLVGADITTVGTIGTGVWQGTAIGDTYISSASTWNAKQSTLVSGTNIKTVNGTTLLGSGNLAVGDALLAGNNSWTATNSFSGSVTGTGSGSFNIHEIITALTLGASNTFGHLESITGTLIASANSQTTTGLYVAPTFTNGAFTGIINNLVNFANKFKVNSAGTVNIANFSSAGFVTNDASGNLVSANSGDVTVDGAGTNTIGANKVTYTKSYNGNQLSIVAAMKILSGN